MGNRADFCIDLVAGTRVIHIFAGIYLCVVQYEFGLHVCKLLREGSLSRQMGVYSHPEFRMDDSLWQLAKGTQLVTGRFRPSLSCAHEVGCSTISNQIPYFLGRYSALGMVIGRCVIIALVIDNLLRAKSLLGVDTTT